MERPASVVKELVENALDAGATRIDVAVEKGGSELIRVADAGCGMTPEQLPLAVAPHATSKLSTAEDLFQVGTLGFRGEALASIAEVSRMRIRSRPAERTAGAELEIDGGSSSEVMPCAAAVGTTIEVRQLFFNTPVRRKFLKTNQTEFGHISEAITRLALPHPQVHFTLTHNGRSVYDLPPTDDWLERVRALLGGELAASMIWVESADGDVRLRGYVAHPSQSRSHPRMQYLFLNGRYIRDRALQHALVEAYRGLLTVGRHPICVLTLQMPAEMVDVNVHPTKMEVRFQDGGRHYSQILATLRTQFLTSDLNHQLQPTSQNNPGQGGGSSLGQDAPTSTSAIHPTNQASAPSSGQGTTPSDYSTTAITTPPDGDPIASAEAAQAKQELLNWFQGQQGDPAGSAAAGTAQPGQASAPGFTPSLPHEPDTPLRLHAFQPPEPAPESTHNRPVQRTELGESALVADPTQGLANSGPANSGLAHPAVSSAPRATGHPGSSHSAPAHPGHPSHPATGRPGPPGQWGGPGMQIANRYLITEDGDSLVIIDQHALHERVLYEQLRRRVLSGSVESQRLLVPQPVDLSAEESAAVLAHQEMLAQAGLGVESFGEATVLVSSYPAMLRDVDVGALVREVAANILAGAQKPDARDLLDSLLHTMSCKAAIKAGDRLTPSEITALLEQRHLAQDAHHCPHGRPTSLVFTREQLDRQFKRS